MKKKSKNYLLIGLISMILGVIIAVQFRTVQGDFLEGSSPFTRLQELNNAYTTVSEERDTLLEEIDEYQTKLSDIENNASSDNILIKNLADELEEYKLFGGFLDVDGEGI